jgi:hypothetical protein
MDLLSEWDCFTSRMTTRGRQDVGRRPSFSTLPFRQQDSFTYDEIKRHSQVEARGKATPASDGGFAGGQSLLHGGFILEHAGRDGDGGGSPRAPHLREQGMAVLASLS